jgi:hypothetical protein
MNWRHWLKGLASAVIGAAANSVTVNIVAPETFNINEGLPKLGTVAAVSALVAAANYLKQSPLPGQKDELGGGLRTYEKVKGIK